MAIQQVSPPGFCTVTWGAGPGLPGVWKGVPASEQPARLRADSRISGARGSWDGNPTILLVANVRVWDDGGVGGGRDLRLGKA